MTNKVAVPLSIAHGEETSRVPIGEAFRMWDTASRKVYIGITWDRDSMIPCFLWDVHLFDFPIFFLLLSVITYRTLKAWTTT